MALSLATRNKRIAKLYSAKVPSREIASKYGVHTSRVVQIARAAGVQIRLAGGTPNLKRRKQAYTLRKKGMTWDAIGAAMNCCGIVARSLALKHEGDLAFTA